MSRIGYTCRGGDPMAFTESECIASGGSWIGQEMPDDAPDFSGIVNGGFNNVVDNADSFLQYPGQTSLSEMKSLGSNVKASSKMGYSNVSDINLSGFDSGDQLKIKSVLAAVDTLGDNTDVCGSIIQSIVDKSMKEVLNDSAILSAYKETSNMIDCGDGMDVINKTKDHIDSYINNTNLSGAGDITTRLASKMNSDLFTALPSSGGPVMSCVCHGGDPMDTNEADCLANGGEWRCQEVSGSAAQSFNTSFMADISSLDNITDVANGACSKLQQTVMAMYEAKFALIAKAAGYLAKLSNLSNITSNNDPCATLDSLIPSEAREYLPNISNALSGSVGGESCVCHGGDPMDTNEADCLANGGEWRCQEISPSKSVSPVSMPTPVSIPRTSIPSIPSSTITDATKMPISMGAPTTFTSRGGLSVNNISGTLHGTITDKISSVKGGVGGISGSLPDIPGGLSGGGLSTDKIAIPSFSFNGERPGLWTKADGTKMTAQEIKAAQEEYI